MSQKNGFKTAALVQMSFLTGCPPMTSDLCLLLVPRVRAKHGEAVCQFHAAKMWSSRPDDVQTLTLSMLRSR